jgi:hypothetical protein
VTATGASPRRYAGFGDTVSVVSGGLACIAGALVLARLFPGFRRQRVSAGQQGTRPRCPAGLAANGRTPGVLSVNGEVDEVSGAFR